MVALHKERILGRPCLPVTLAILSNPSFVPSKRFYTNDAIIYYAAREAEWLATRYKPDPDLYSRIRQLAVS